MGSKKTIKIEFFKRKKYANPLIVNRIEAFGQALSRAIKWLNGSYATYVNTKRKKGGYPISR